MFCMVKRLSAAQTDILKFHRMAGDVRFDSIDRLTGDNSNFGIADTSLTQYFNFIYFSVRH